MGAKYDFSGWATRNNLRCSDGRTIRKDAFKHNNGKIVPLVWNHNHNDLTQVLGHALLENRDEGVYAYCSFNDSDLAQDAKIRVQHGDFRSLSIFANHLKQENGNVLHGEIREVSLVLAGANPGACIDFTSDIEHSDEDSEFEAIIYNNEEDFDLEHADGPAPKEPEKKGDEMAEEKEKTPAEGAETLEDIYNTLSEKQKNAVKIIVGQAIEDATNEEDSEGGDDMKHNAFETDVAEKENTNVLSHSDVEEIFKSANRMGSLRDAFQSFADNNDLDADTLQHSIIDHNGNEITYGIANMDYLFPEYKNLTERPEFIKRKTEWVARVMGGVHHTPFSRIKSMFADITMDDARAKGYIKGNLKKEEVFSLLKRTTDPTTVYKKQKFDRDDIIDVTDFDVVAWVKSEMRMMLDEELARAILIGDGRLSSSDEKIDPTKIRPIWTDDRLLFVIEGEVEYETTDTEADKVNKIIDQIIISQEDYDGSGNPVMFCKKRFLTRALLLRNGIGERVYKNKRELADELGVADIIPVPQFNNQTRTEDGETLTLEAIVVNMADYNVGADKGGQVAMFEDFDINYNRQLYLIETRMSGALTKPKSAIVIESKAASGD